MRKGFLPALCALIAGASVSLAQYPYPYAVPGYGYGYGYPAQAGYYYAAPAQAGYYYGVPAQAGYYGMPAGWNNRYYQPNSYNLPVYTVSQPAATVVAAGVLPEAEDAAPAAADAKTESAAAPAEASTAKEEQSHLVPLDQLDNDPLHSEAPTEDLGCATCGAPCGPRIWARAEYLLWWLSGAPLPVPLVTTGPPESGGVLGQPGTTVLFGGGDQGLGTFSGTRLTLGGWLDSNRKFGVEGGGFLLEQRSIAFNASSDATGAPVLAVPFINVGPGGGPDNAYIVTTPLAPFVGGVGAFSSTRLWGADACGVLNLYRNCRASADLLAGFRYLDLDENLNLYVNSIDGLSDPQLTDGFDTRNQFYGGVLGGRLSFWWNKLSLDCQSRVSLGANHERVLISGNGVFPGIGPQAALPGGIFALPTNIGRYEDSKFNAIPEVQVRLGYEVLKNLRVFTGYTFLYWADVVRPGDQINPVLNGSQIQSFLAPPPTPLIGPAAPLPQMDHSAFFAHGVSFGAELRY